MPASRRNVVILTAVLAVTIPIVAHAQTSPATQLKNLPPGENVLWSDPGDVASLDFAYGPGGEQGAPVPPFQFVEEDLGGTNPKVKVTDAKGVHWSVKFGGESKPSVFATRMAWACGYNVETEYLIPHGQIAGVHGLKRARGSIQGGAFTDARFQLRSDDPKYLNEANWAWPSNPFLGTPQLNGLKILAMLLSNWDTKDARDRDTASHDASADSNLGIFQAKGTDRPRYLFLITDWGETMGHWGANAGKRNKWNCKDYSQQTPDFVKGVDHGIVRFGYSGKNNADIVQGIRVSDVQWLMQYLGRITDEQLRRGLAASAATPDEIECFLTAIRQRIGQLNRIAAQ